MDDLFSVSTTETKREINENKKNGFEKKSNKNGEKQDLKKIAIFSALLILLITASIFGYRYYKSMTKPAKPYIIEFFEKADLLGMFEIEGFKNLSNNLNNKSFEVLASGKIDPKFLSKEDNQDKDQDKTNNEINIPKDKNESDKLKIKDFDFVFKGAVNNREESKSNLMETNIVWDKTTVTSWKKFENDDVLLIEAPEYFKEMIGINKENVNKVLESDSNIAETYINLLSVKDENAFEEIMMLSTVIKKSLISSLDKLATSNFSVDKKVSTTYKDEKQYADNYKVVLDKITLNIIFENLLKDIDTSLRIDASRYKSFSKNKEQIKNIIKKFKPNIEDTDKLELTLYKMKGNVPKIDVILKNRKGEESKIFQLEQNIEKSKDEKRELTAIFGSTKIRIGIRKEKDQNLLNIDFETLKSSIKNIKTKDIKIKNPDKKGPETKEENKPSTDITGSVINEKNKTYMNVRADRYQLLSNNETPEINESNIGNVVEDREKSLEEKSINADNLSNKPVNIEGIMNAKEDEKIFFKINLSTPVNTSATNMKIDLDIFSNVIDINLAGRITFKEAINIDMMDGDRVFLDKLTDSERKAMFENLIKPTIVSVTAKKLDEISKKKKSIENSNKEQQGVEVTENTEEIDTNIDEGN